MPPPQKKKKKTTWGPLFLFVFTFLGTLFQPYRRWHKQTLVFSLLQGAQVECQDLLTDAVCFLVPPPGAAGTAGGVLLRFSSGQTRLLFFFVFFWFAMCVGGILTRKSETLIGPRPVVEEKLNLLVIWLASSPLIIMILFRSIFANNKQHEKHGVPFLFPS